MSRLQNAFTVEPPFRMACAGLIPVLHSVWPKAQGLGGGEVSDGLGVVGTGGLVGATFPLLLASA
jgi:hypothetical protein